MENRISSLQYQFDDSEYFFAPNVRTAQVLNNLKKIKHGIYIYENFVPSNLVTRALMQLNEMTHDDWYTIHNNYEPGDLANLWENGKISTDMMGDGKVSALLFNFFTPEYVNTGRNAYVIRLLPGDFVDQKRGKHPTAKNPNFNAEFKVGIYFGEWEGGEICFPEIDLQIKPKQGDMIIWKAAYEHFVSPVTSGVRYSYSDFLVKAPDLVVA